MYVDHVSVESEKKIESVNLNIKFGVSSDRNMICDLIYPAKLEGWSWYLKRTQRQSDIPRITQLLMGLGCNMNFDTCGPNSLDTELHFWWLVRILLTV